MMRSLVRAELRLVWSETAFRIALLVLVIPFIFALAVGVLRSRAETRQLDALVAGAAANNAELARNITNRSYFDSTWSNLENPGVVGMYGYRALVVLPRLPLSLFAIGQRDVSPTALRITSHADPFRDRYDALQNARLLAVGAFDLSFFLIQLLPLLIIALAYGLVSSERDRGTLALLLAEPVRFAHLLAARVLVRGLVVAALTGVLTLLGAVTAGISLDGETALRLALIEAAILVYAAFWFALALAVQRLRRSPQMNALLCLGAWLVLVVVGPAVLNVSLTESHPLPSRTELVAATRDAQLASNQGDARALDRYYEDHPDLAKPEDAAASYWELYALRSRMIRTALAPLEDRFAGALAAQQAFVETAESFVPPVAVQSAISDLAGTGLARHRRFIAQVYRYHTTYRTHFEDRSLRNERFTAADVERIPRFVFEEEPRSDLVIRTLRRLGVLLLAVVALFVVAFRRADQIEWLLSKD